ncbi:MAG: UDP-N-acetylmuramate dehydrogenase [Bacteroidetes bacterium]|nr:UDP-N-acetylmuramate dehydrogenase [Bacteroidota bacterium]
MEAEALAGEVARAAGLPRGRVLVNEPLAPRTSFRIGGPAEVFAVARSREEMAVLERAARRLGIDCRVMGGGTNLLVADAGVRGLVIANRTDRVVLAREDDGRATVWADSGAPLSRLAVRACRAGLAGLEFAVGIPGTLGGAVVGNAGAFGGAMADVVAEAEVLNGDGEVVRLPAAELAFAYRTSRFRQGPGQREVVLGAALRLRTAPAEDLLARAAANRRGRRRTQPRGRCAGSIFRNPPRVEGEEGNRSAGYCIEKAGLKGHAIGGARVSPVHANFIVNDGGATAAEVCALISLARERVFKQFGIEMQLEIQLWGDMGVLS